MASIVAAGALSHSPIINFPPPAEAAEAIARYRGIAKRLSDHLRGASPDVLIVIGQDHFRTLFYDLMPPFVIATGRVEAWGDWKTAKGVLNGMPELGRYLHRSLLASEFDVACSYDLRVDHGVAQPLQLLDWPLSIPILPVLINTGAPPMPTPYRCYKFGKALGAGVANFPNPLRVALVGSGGISHSPPSGNVESEDPAEAALVHRLIHGRATVVADEASRQERLVSAVRAGKFPGSVRPQWDRMILDALAHGEAETLARSLDEASIDRDGGYGGHEVRTWLAIAGACEGRAIEVLGYEPIEWLITGMGAIRAA